MCSELLGCMDIWCMLYSIQTIPILFIDYSILFRSLGIYHVVQELYRSHDNNIIPSA